MTTPTSSPVFGARPTLIGHRGMGRGSVDGYLENTRAGLLAGVEAGLRWVELDVRRTADDRLVVGHFPTYPDGTFMASLPLADARELGALTLAELIEGLPAGIGVNIDLKTALEDALRPAGATIAALVAPVAQELAAERPVLVSSFDASAMRQLRERAPEVRRAFLTWVSFPLRKAIPAAVHLGADVVAAHWSSFGPNAQDHAPVFVTPQQAIDIAHRGGLEVMAWCPEPEPARALFGAGIDAVVIDDVPRSLTALRGVAD